MTMPHVFTDYLEDVFVPELFQSLVPRAIERARKIHEKHPYDAIAFTGTSGCSLGFILGYTLNIPIICIVLARRYEDGIPIYSCRKDPGT